ncbi:hypothetical protein QQZ08_001230 [Neonectria magnoliae]|uniref:Uncharacterized protein n=1 Tax=Neonectria magnoliae TaxID=2732573 RepID=A0ABR1IG57_9HYPO
MWRYLIPLLLHSARALPAASNATGACPHDALYTSLVSNGIAYCSSVIKDGHCGGGYSTPPAYMTYNQTQISSYCRCIITSSDATARTLGSGSVTTGDPTATTGDPASETSDESVASTGTQSSTSALDQSSMSTSGSPAGRPDPGRPSVSSDVGSLTAPTRSASNTGTAGNETSPVPSTRSSGAVTSGAVDTSANWTFTGSRTFNGERSSASTGNLSTSTSSEPPGSASTLTDPSFNTSRTFRANTNAGTRSATSAPTGMDTTLSRVSLTSTFAGWNSSATSDVGSLTAPGSRVTGTAASSTGSASGSASGATSASEGTAMTVPTSDTSPIVSNTAPTANSSSTASNSSPSGTTSSISGRSSRQNTSQSANSSSPAGNTGPTVKNASPTSSGPVSTTNLAETSATTASNTGFLNSTSSQVGNVTATGAPEFPAANFTQVTRTATFAQETCYSLARGSEDDPTRRALLHNAQLREENATIPVPYIESVHFESGGVDPLYLTIRDEAEDTYFVDISNRNQLSVVDAQGNTMLLDANGIHFSTPNCTYSVCVKINNMLQQLARLAGVECAATQREKRIDDLEFTQILNLHDQCGNPVDRTLRQYPQLRVGDSACTDTRVDEETGEWEFDCTFPGSLSGATRCELAIKNDVVDFLLTDPFGGSCPDLTTVITTLEATGRDFLNVESFRIALQESGLNETQRTEADAAAVAFDQLWEVLQQILSKSRPEGAGDASALEDYIDVYGTYRDLENDICEDLHEGEIPLNLSLVAGTTRIDAITSFNFAPDSPRPYNITIQDPSERACCPNGAVATDDGDTCAYPREAIVDGTSCICGTTVGGASLAFEYTECDNFVSECDGDADCAEAGYAGFVCLTGSCCDGGVCVDPYACSQNGTELVRFGRF